MNERESVCTMLRRAAEREERRKAANENRSEILLMQSERSMVTLEREIGIEWFVGTDSPSASASGPFSFSRQIVVLLAFLLLIARRWPVFAASTSTRLDIASAENLHRAAIARATAAKPFGQVRLSHLHSLLRRYSARPTHFQLDNFANFLFGIRRVSDCTPFPPAINIFIVDREC